VIVIKFEYEQHVFQVSQEMNLSNRGNFSKIVTLQNAQY